MPTFTIRASSKSALGENEFDRLLDAVRGAIELTRPPPEPLIAANDDQLVWPLIPFPESE
jgi:hypothetical protein